MLFIDSCCTNPRNLTWTQIENRAKIIYLEKRKNQRRCYETEIYIEINRIEYT